MGREIISALIVLLALAAGGANGCTPEGGDDEQESTPGADDDLSGADDDSGDDDDDNDDNDDITPAEPDDDAWAIEDVAKGVDPALGFDADQGIHVAYHSLENGYVSHALKRAGEWEIESTGDTGEQVAMAVDGAGAVHLAYRRLGDDGWILRYGTDAGGSWWNCGVTTDYSLVAAAVAVDLNNDALVVSASDPFDPYNGDATENVIGWSWNGDVWAQETLFTTKAYELSTFSVSAVFDAGGARHLVFYDLNWRAIHYKGPAGDWRDVPGKEIGQLSWLAVDAAGAPHLAYTGVDNWLRYETHADGDWRGEHMMQLGYGRFRPAIAVDANGAAHIVARRVYDWENEEGPNELRYVTNRSGKWIYSVIDTLSTNEPWSDLGVAIDAEGYVHVVYFKYEGFHFSEGRVYHAVSPEPYGAPQ
jgi:hypothetical protein